MGETSSPVVPVTAVAASQSCRRAEMAAVARPIAANATGTAIHQPPMCPCPDAILIAVAYGDWLLMYGAPTRWVSANRCRQYRREASGATKHPVSPQATNVAAATIAARVRRASSRNTMKMAGVSLIAAATPIPMPTVLLSATRPCARRHVGQDEGQQDQDRKSVV